MFCAFFENRRVRKPHLRARTATRLLVYTAHVERSHDFCGGAGDVGSITAAGAYSCGEDTTAVYVTISSPRSVPTAVLVPIPGAIPASRDIPACGLGAVTPPNRPCAYISN